MRLYLYASHPFLKPSIGEHLFEKTIVNCSSIIMSSYIVKVVVL